MYNGNMYNSPYLYNTTLQRQEVIRVNGRNGAEAYQMAPNSSILLLDETAPIVWLKTTDATSILSTSFTTLVQVPESSNINCPCSVPTTISFVNDGIEATYNTFDVTVVRV